MSRVDDEDLRVRILDAAATLFAQHGYSGTKVGMVAKAAGTTTANVRRITGGRSQLFEQVMSQRVTSSVAERLAAAAKDPAAVPPLAVVLAAAQELFTAPESSWDILELEALTRAHLDGEIRVIETERIATRWENTAALISQVRSSGGLDDDISDRAVAHLLIALSAGLALMDPVLTERPTVAQWNALIARVGTAVAPQEFLLNPTHEAHRRWRVRVDVPDRPGGVARLIRALSALHVYAIGFYVIGAKEGYRTVDLAITAPKRVSSEAIRATAGSVGRTVYVRDGSADDAIDLPTRVLDGAANLISDPSWAPLAAAILVEADEVTVVGATEGSDDQPDTLRLQWTANQHVVLRRDWAPFARAERSRASAFLRLSAAIAESLGAATPWVFAGEVKGRPLRIRLAQPADADAVAAMHDRCSDQSKYQRYFTITEWRDVQLHRLAGGHRGATLVVLAEDDTIVGLGNVFPDEPGDGRTAEIAMIVEDAQQGRGIGKVLLGQMISMAQLLGFSEIVASVLADNNGMLRLLEKSGLSWSATTDSGVRTLRAEIKHRPVV
ncbi:MAG: GNAT family N-acetyltransferase [Actinobacteria bacterium]|nr:GNAT family N-acetyltransferase [Actinomycetota bacterium]